MDDPFTKDGFAPLPGLLGPDLLEVIRPYADDLAARAHDPLMSRPGADLVPLRWSHPIAAAVLADAQVVNRLQTALGAPDLAFVSAYVASKPPGSPALHWHQDWWAWRHPLSHRPAAAQVALLVYLHATGPDRGALRLIPGSHRRRLALHAHIPDPHSDEARELGPHHPAIRAQPDEVMVAARPGDAVVLDYRLLHATAPHRGEARRNGLILSFTPDWAGLPHDIRAHLALHPALPAPDERCAATQAVYASLLPRFEGEPRSVAIERRAFAR